MPNNRSDAALRERLKLAEKATQGPWYHTLAAIVGTKKSPEDNDATCICSTEWGCSGDSQANAAYIAASSPDVVRADIEEILRLRGENKLLNSMVMSFAGKAVHETVGGWWTGWKGEKFLTKKAAIMSLIVKVKSELK
ncbi:ead/Ea22-like family protein [Desulfovibrio sp.]|uniref:ead/Ea22-like family protein n=1 Tax=Desulfovibrio sp. TaxID=885 RepID=UPI003FF0B86B